MPPVCSICVSPLAPAVEKLVADGFRPKVISVRLGLSYETTKRHVREHVKRPGGRAPSARRSAKVASGGTTAGPAGSSVSSTCALVVPPTPVDTFERAFGYPARDYQRDYLTSSEDTVWLKGRQIGASQSAAALAIDTALRVPGSDSVIVSASQRQSSEVARRGREGLRALGVRLLQDSASILKLTNGSRVVSLAASDRAVRGYSAALLVMDEAAFIEDAVWNAARPMTSATGGRTVVQSTPGAPVGWFHDIATAPPPRWKRLLVKSADGGVSPEFLDKERDLLPPHVYLQEYEAVFASEGSLGRWFDEAGFDARINPAEDALDVDLKHAERR